MRKRQMSGNDVEITEAGQLSLSNAPDSNRPTLRVCGSVYVLIRVDRWFKDGVDVNEVEINEAHW